MKVLEEITDLYPPHDDVDMVALADMISAVTEGGIVMARGLGEPSITSQQVLLLRSYYKLLFTPRAQ
jgi:hypothetical protein